MLDWDFVFDSMAFSLFSSWSISVLSYLCLDLMYLIDLILNDAPYFPILFFSWSLLHFWVLIMVWCLILFWLPWVIGMQKSRFISFQYCLSYIFPILDYSLWFCFALDILDSLFQYFINCSLISSSLSLSIHLLHFLVFLFELHVYCCYPKHIHSWISFHCVYAISFLCFS